MTYHLSQMRKHMILLLGLFVVATALVYLILFRFDRAARKEAAVEDTASASESIRIDSARPQSVDEPPMPERSALESSFITDAILQAAAAIEGGANPQAVLHSLRAFLLSQDPALVVSAIRAYLQSGQDALTGLPFAVGQSGDFATLPSMRCFLMDFLAYVDASAALEVAEEVFNARSSADEYAVCLRNAGTLMEGADGRAYVGQRALELLSDGNMAANASAGFAEAFDAVVYAGDLSAFTLLSQYVGGENGSALGKAAFFAMDRMTLDNTAEAIELLTSDASLLADNARTKAGLIARADLSDSAQLADVESYVLSLSSDSGEASYYFDIVPNNNFAIINGMLTDTYKTSHDYVTGRLGSTYDTLGRWAVDERFAAYSDLIESARQRIEEIRGE